MVRPATATTATGSTLASVRAPHTNAVYSARVQNPEVATPLYAESRDTAVNYAVAPSQSPAKPWLLALPVMAIGALILAIRKSAAGPKTVSLDSVAVAPVTGYKVTPIRQSTALKAADSETKIDESVVGEIYEVELEKPIGISLARGNDGATYIARVPPGEKFDKFTPGDKVTKCSASFGPEVWEALNYGQVMFAIKTRNGNVFLELERRGGDMSIFEKKKSSRFSQERAGGNYGAGTAELQAQNYAEQQELQKKREALWRDAVGNVKAKKYEDALVQFENIIGLEPAGFIGDDFAATSELFRISHYQMACVYSLMGNNEAALESLSEALSAGFSDFDQIRDDPELASVRAEPEFEEIMGKYDEGVINMEAINAIKGVFGGLFGGK
jgi:tetratricopeptide (TPR) repeat protein